MGLYTKDSIDRVKDAVEMVELVSARTDLRRVGTRHTGLCPFHEERTPSFSVNAEHKLYHCFGCGASGDAIRFVQETEGLDFKSAVELLAERYGVELRQEREDPDAERRRRRRERLLDLVGRTATFYARYLWEAEEAAPARAYLASRGFEEEALRRFSVGYSPDAWERVTAGALRDGFTPEEVLAAGIGQRGKRGGLIDRFRGRIMFPLADARGRVLGFGARALREGQQPKYLNTSENELYHKGRQLFGVDHARAPAARAGHVVVVEGYTDVLALHQAGIDTAVAIMGTALTQDQLGELARVARLVYVALDADRSGQEAMLRAGASARERDVELRVVGLPEDVDPAELVAAEGAEGFRGRLERALSVPEFEVRRVIADADLETPRGRDAALERALPIVAGAGAPAIQEDLVRYVADRVDVDANVVNDMLRTRGGARSARSRASGRVAHEQRPNPSVDPVFRTERHFLAMSLSQGDVGRRYLTELRDEHLSSEPLRRARDWILEHFEDPLAGMPDDDPPFAALIAEIAATAEAEPSSETLLRMDFLQLELRRIERDLRHSQRTGRFERQRELGRARMDAQAQIAELMGQTG